MYLPQNIKYIRFRLNENQEEFGNRFGVSAVSVSKWESGTNEMGVRMLLLLEDISGYTISDMCRKDLQLDAAVRAGISLKELQIQLRHYSLEEVGQYIRQLGVHDLQDLEGKFPAI
jgi:transcriptional regulator with XRE-family HTH domain